MRDEGNYLKYENLQSIAEARKRKTAAVTTLKEKIVELETSTENLGQIINESTRYEIHCITKLMY